ncbi:MAG: kelch repeat-containing protein [Bacteroidota bacterium]
MKKQLLFIVSLILIRTTNFAQCSFTTAITSAGGSTVACGNAILTAIPTSNTWTQKANIGGSARGNAVGFSIGSKGYIGTGNNGGPQNSMWEYDPASDAWTQKTNFPGTARYDAAGFSIGSKGYIGCGYDNSYNYKNDFYEYDPTTNAWTQKASFPGVGRQAPVGFCVGTKGYMGLGYFYSSGNIYYSDFYEYDPITDAWSAKTSFPGSGRAFATAFSLGSKGYVGTGSGGSGVLNDFYEFNPTSDTWTQKTNLPSASYYAASFAVNGKGYIGTGYGTSYSRTRDFYEYDAIADTWTQKLNFMGSSRASAVAFSIGDKGYIGGGNEGNFTNDFYEYSPYNLTYSWSNGATTAINTVTSSGTYSVIITAQDGCTLTAIKTVSVVPDATLSISGPTVVCAGTNITLNAITGGATTYTWIGGVSNGISFTPASSSIYTLTGSLGACTKTVTQSVFVNTVPIATITPGGPTTVCSSNVLLTANTTDNNWTQKTDFGGGYRGQSVSFSIGSKGYITLGWTGSVSKTDLWEYDPISNAWTQKANFPGEGRSQGIGFSIGNKGYAGLGVISGNNKPTDFWEYDPSTNEWTQKANFGGVGRQSAVGFSILNKGYAGTGLNSSYLSDFWEYDPATDAWTAKASYPFVVGWAAGFAIGNKGYLGTGYSGYYRNDFYEYNPATDIWTQKASVLGGRAEATGISTSTKGYIGLGSDGTYKNDFLEYNPTANTWIARTNFPGSARDLASGFSINNKVYLGLGTFPSEQTDFYEYSPAASFLWNTGNTTAAITATASGTYSVTLSNLSGCISSASQTVNILPNPTVTISSPTFVCSGGSTSLTAIPNSTETYTWSGGITDGTVFTPTATANYSLNATLGTCSKSFSRTITVNLPANITAAGPTTFCGSSLNLTASPAGTYTWNTGANTSLITTTVTNTYSVTVTDPDGCISGKSQTVSIAPSPTLSAIGGTVICEGNSVTLTAAGATSYSWTGGVSNGVSFTPAASSNYTVMGAIGNCTQSLTQYVTVNSAPSATLTAGGPTSACGSSVVLTGSTASDTWNVKTGIGSPRRYAVAFNIGNKGYMGTGGVGTAGKNDFWEYDPATNAWTQKANVPGSNRYSAIGFSINGKGYIGTGTVNGSTVLNDFYEYDPSANTWTTKANFAGGTRQGAVGFTIGNKGYVGTGLSVGVYKNDFYEYNPVNNTWTVKASLPTVRNFAAGFSIGGKGYIGTGQSSTLGTSRKNDFYEYDPSTNAWTSKAVVGAMIRASATGFSIGNKGYMAVGINSVNVNTNDLIEYDPATDSWTSKSAFPGIIRNAASAFVIGNKAFLGTGVNGITTINDLNEYTPLANYTWSIPVSSSSTLAAITATSNGTYTLMVSDQVGCSTAITQTVSVAIPTLAVSDMTICSGVNAVISPSGADSYTISGGSFTVSPMATTSYTITGSNNDGTCAASNTVIATVYVNASPTITVNSATICPGASVTLVPIGAWSYSITGNSFTVAPLTTTSYSITGTDVNGCSASNSAVATVSINTATTLSVTGTTLVCSGNSTSLTASGASSYTWTGGITNGIAFTPAVTTNYTVSGSVGTCTGSAVITVSVSDTPTISASSATICSGNSYSIIASGANTLSITGGSFIVSPLTTTSYTVTGTNFVGCSNFIVSTVSVNTTPTITVNNATICSGNSAVISPTGAGAYNITGGNFTVSPISNTSYTVSGTTNGCTSAEVVSTVSVNTTPTITVNSATICSGNSAVITPTGAGAYNITGGNFTVSPISNTSYTVSGTTNGCTSAEVVSTVSVNTTPTITVNSATICSGNSVVITPTGAGSYSITGGNFTVSPISNTSYTVSGTTNGCTSAEVVSTVSVNTTPTITVNNATICSGNSAEITPTGAVAYNITGGNFTVSPISNTSYTVSGTTNGCTSAEVVSTVSVNTTPTITVNNATICSGNSAVITPTGAGAYNITGGNFTVSPISNTSYTVSGTTNGCTSAEVVSTVSVNTTPTITVNNATICSGNSAVITPTGAGAYNITGGNFTVSPISNTSYTVSGTTNGCTSAEVVSTVSVNTTPTITVNDATICSGNSVVITPTGAGFYSITGGNFTVSPTSNTPYTVSGTTNGCTSAEVVSTVSVNTTPTITVNDGVICEGQSFTLTPGGANTYTYSNSSPVVNPVLTSTYSVSGTSLDGCISTIDAVATVTVNAIPTISVVSASICAGATGTLIASGADTYTWSTGSNANSIIDNPGITEVYSVNGTSAEGCLGTNFSATITVGSAPAIVVNSESVCAGSSVTLTANGVTSYTWSTGEHTSSIVVTPTANTVYDVTGHLAGCSVNATNESTVTVNALPIVSINSATICEGQVFTLIATGADSYTYSSGSAIVSPTTTTTYSVTGTSLEGCMSASDATATVEVNALTEVTLNISSNIVCLNGAPILLNGFPAGGDYSGTNVSGNSFDPLTSGTFTPVYTYTDASTGCENSAVESIVVETCTGIKEIESSMIRLYPNPTSNSFVIESNSTELKTIKVTDVTGRSVLEISSDRPFFHVDIQNLATGFYHVSIQTPHHHETIKLVKN